MENKVCKLLTGVECELVPMMGKHQRILTQGKNLENGKGINEVLADCIIRLGLNTNVDLRDVEKMPSADRKEALIQLRYHTMDGDPHFTFDYEYKDEKGHKKSTPMDLEADLEEYPRVPYPVQCEDYDSLARECSMILPQSEREVKWEILTGEDENRALELPKNKISSHSPIQLRRPKVQLEAKDGKERIWTALDLDTTTFKDVEALRKKMIECEGSIDTSMVLENPDTGEEVLVDVISVKAFFFPSGVL